MINKIIPAIPISNMITIIMTKGRNTKPKNNIITTTKTKQEGKITEMMMALHLPNNNLIHLKMVTMMKTPIVILIIRVNQRNQSQRKVGIIVV